MKRTREGVIPDYKVRERPTMPNFGDHVHKLGLHPKSNEDPLKDFIHNVTRSDRQF